MTDRAPLQDVDVPTYYFNWYEEQDSIRGEGENRIISCTVVFDDNDRIIRTAWD